ncbi:MAG: agmatine deiminase family protein [Bacteroidales bacterium]|nr:agmatine deiminase family protein [Bacteroidales bacterium]
MINDSQTNKVYLAEGLSHYEEAFGNLREALEERSIATAILPRTASEKHVWARDYMPLQLRKGAFLLYEYLPDYLKDSEEYIPDFRAIAKDLGLDCATTDIVLDGGNVVKCGGKFILTDKIFAENPKWYRLALVAELERLLKAQAVIIPWDRYEMFGHADGMVRYISGSRVLLNDYCDFDPYLRERLLKCLRPHFEVEELEFDVPRRNRLSWAYLNFLQVGNCIFVPGLGAREDALAVRQLRHFFPRSEVVQIQGCAPLARDGGALNCVSWNILA